MSLYIREILPEDAAAITILSNQLGYPVTENTTRENIVNISNSIYDAMWIIFLDDKVAGWIHVFKTTRIESGTFGEIGGMVVDEKFRRKGIGRLLVDQAKHWCVSRNITALRVRCNNKRTGAHTFYTSLQFREIKVQKVFEMPLSD